MKLKSLLLISLFSITMNYTETTNTNETKTIVTEEKINNEVTTTNVNGN